MLAGNNPTNRDRRGLFHALDHGRSMGPRQAGPLLPVTIARFLVKIIGILTKWQGLERIFDRIISLRLKLMRYSLALRVFCAAAFAFSAPALSVSAQAQDTHEIIVPANDGYGMDDCLAQGGTCAKLVADSWCQINGLKASASYREADPADITGALSHANLTTDKQPVYIVTCTE